MQIPLHQLIVATASVVVVLVIAAADGKVLDLTSMPDMSKLPESQQRQLLPRSVNLSFFVPAFSLFALASQYMPQMFPSLTTTTSSKKRGHSRGKREEPQEYDWIENVVRKGLVNL